MVFYIEDILDNWYKYGDPRSSQWFLTDSPYTILAIVLFNVFLVKLILPAIFKGKKHPRFKIVLASYYMIHSLLSGCFIFLWFLAFLGHSGFNWRCESIVPAFDGIHYQIALAAYIWLLTKVSEIFDSVFLYITYGKVTDFVFYHHILVPIILTTIVHFYPGGSPAFFVLLHSIDHAIIFFFLTFRVYSDKFRVKSEIWFKKLQFILAVVVSIIGITFFLQLETRDDCNYEVFAFGSTAGLLVLFILMLKFRWNYILPKKDVKIVVKRQEIHDYHLTILEDL